MASFADDEMSSYIPRVSEKLDGATNSNNILTNRHHSTIPNGTFSSHSPDSPDENTGKESYVHLTEKSQQHAYKDGDVEPKAGQENDHSCRDCNQHQNSSEYQDSDICSSCSGYRGSHNCCEGQHNNFDGLPAGRSDSNVKDEDGEEEEARDADKESHDASCRRQLTISVILTLLCYIMGMLSLSTLQSQYLFYRFALDYFNITNVTSNKQVPCAANSNNTFQRDIDQIQTRTSHQVLYLDYCQFIPAMFVCLFVGSYADYLGRKYLMFIPLTGAFIKSVIYLLVIYLKLDVSYLFLGFATDGISGSLYVLLLGLSASVADVTTTATQRVLLFALLDISLAIAGSVSQIGTGFLISFFGYTWPSLIICCLLLLGCVVVLVYMPETLHRPDHIILNPCFHLRKVFGFYFFDGTRQQRGLYLLGLIFFFFSSMVIFGKDGVELLYLLNSPFCWDSVKIGIFIGIRILVNNLLSILALKVMSKSVRMEIIGMLGLMSGIASCSVEAFAYNDAMMYISAALAVLASVVPPISRTLLSKMASAKSQGALFASVSALQTVCHLTSTTAYNQVYTATLSVFRGAVFLLIVGFLVISLILLIVFAIASPRVNFNHEDLEVEYKVEANTAARPSARNNTISIMQSQRRPNDDTDENQPLLQSLQKSSSSYNE